MCSPSSRHITLENTNCSAPPHITSENTNYIFFHPTDLILTILDVILTIMPQDRKQPNENDGSEKKSTLSQFSPTTKCFKKNKKKNIIINQTKRGIILQLYHLNPPSPVSTRSRTLTTDKVTTPSQSIHSTALKKIKIYISKW